MVLGGGGGVIFQTLISGTAKPFYEVTLATLSVSINCCCSDIVPVGCVCMCVCTCACMQMLLNLHKKSWMEGLTLQDYSEHCKLNETIVKEMLELAKNYNKVMTRKSCKC